MSPDSLPDGQRANATLGWAATGIVALAAVESLRTGALLWGGLVLLVAVVAAVPAAVTGSPTAMVPWPIHAIAAAAVVLRAIGRAPEVARYVALGALALLVVVELDGYTHVEVSRRFTVVFAAMTTMALEAWWIVAQYVADRVLGTAFLRSQTELQWDMVAVTAVGVGIGVVAAWALDRVDPGELIERSATR